MLIFVTGGARSGKSQFAEQRAAGMGSKVLYVATATASDDEMSQRIRTHKSRRPAGWTTVEAYCNLRREITSAFDDHNAVLLDCVTLMINNIMQDGPVHLTEQRVKGEIDSLIETVCILEIPLVVVSNEVGMGLVPADHDSRLFRDIAGRINQHIAAVADQFYVMMSGIPLKVK